MCHRAPTGHEGPRWTDTSPTQRPPTDIETPEQYRSKRVSNTQGLPLQCGSRPPLSCSQAPTPDVLVRRSEQRHTRRHPGRRTQENNIPLVPIREILRRTPLFFSTPTDVPAPTPYRVTTASCALISRIGINKRTYSSTSCRCATAATCCSEHHFCARCRLRFSRTRPIPWLSNAVTDGLHYMYIYNTSARLPEKKRSRGSWERKNSWASEGYVQPSDDCADGSFISDADELYGAIHFIPGPCPKQELKPMSGTAR
jgi:hypothetical protein